MKTKILITLFLSFFIIAGLKAQITIRNSSVNPSVSITNPINNHVYDLASGNSVYPLGISVDYTPSISAGPRRVNFNDGSSDYDIYFDAYFVYVSGEFPDINVTPGTHTWTVTTFILGLTWSQEATTSITFTVQPTLTVENSYGSGSVLVNGETRNSGYVFNPTPGSTVGLTAIDRPQVGNYVRTFKNWSCSYISPGSGISVSVSAPSAGHGSAMANFRKLYNVTFTANIDGYFTVGSGSQSVPYIAEIVETYSTSSVTAYSQSAGPSLWGTFIKWNDGSTATTKTITPTDHITYIAYYKLRPTNDYRQLMFNSTIGDPITLTWNEHPNTNVTSYNIYRRRNAESTPTLIASVSRGTTTYVDNDFVITENTGLDSRIFYDVRAVYSGSLPDNTPYTMEAAANAQMQFGAPEAAIIKEKEVAAAKTTENLSIAPTEYSLGSYPNPFNPTTVIRYTMPEAGQVSLKVYNILSQEVANLVESNQSAGVHQVNFNASHLPTGIYIARLQAGAKVMTAKLQLVK